MQVFNEIDYVSSVSIVYKILKFEIRLHNVSPFIYHIQRQDKFFINQQEMTNALRVLTFFNVFTLRAYIHISNNKYKKKLKSNVIDNIGQTNPDTLPVLIENCCCRMHLVLARKDGHLSIVYNLWRYSKSLKNVYADKMFRHFLNTA